MAVISRRALCSGTCDRSSLTTSTQLLSAIGKNSDREGTGRHERSESSLEKRLTRAGCPTSEHRGDAAPWPTSTADDSANIHLDRCLRRTRQLARWHADGQNHPAAERVMCQSSTRQRTASNNPLLGDYSFIARLLARRRADYKGIVRLAIAHAAAKR
jgi:hypothetical protein